VLDRLAGLETEYAIRFGRSDKHGQESRYGLYQRLIERLRQFTPLVRAFHFKEGVFMANGGAVWFESERPASGAGLIEGSTPECRGVYCLLTYQRALDRLLAQSTSGLDGSTGFALLKNDRDGFDNVYGGQENYQVRIASGAGLWAWRLGLLLMAPLVLVSWVGFYLLVGLLLFYMFFAGVLFLVLHRAVSNRRRLASLLFGRDLAEGRETGAATPQWMEHIVLHVTRILSAPLAVALYLQCRWFAFRQVRQRLTPFLVSRCILSGAGYVNRSGDLQLADKAPAINCLVGFGGYLADRPLYTMGHFFKALCAECLFGLKNYLYLFSPYQRLQLGLGDSNMCEYAEFLKIGTTQLVLDAIEAGFLERVPRLRNAIRALHGFAADITLQHEESLSDGTMVCALQLQRFYLEACRRFVACQTAPPTEAHIILQRWEEALDKLTEYRTRVIADASSAVLPLVGVFDWASKAYLVAQLGREASWEEKKKIDLRYHELSGDGYYMRLERCGAVQRVVQEADIERAMRMPPPDSPATRRGRFIREFADGDQEFRVHWRSIVIGQGRFKRVISLDDDRVSRAHRSESSPTTSTSAADANSWMDESDRDTF
jgi:hypothetical protein